MHILKQTVIKQILIVVTLISIIFIFVYWHWLFHKPMEYWDNQYFKTIIENQKIKVAKEMESFIFDEETNLTNYVIEKGGEPIRAMVSVSLL